MSDEDDDETGGEGAGEAAAEDEGPTLEDGDSVEVESSSSSSTYTLTRHGNVYMCSCPAWKNQSLGVDLRTCKHLRAYFGEEREAKRVGGAVPSRAATVSRSSGGSKSSSASKKETAPPVLLAHKWETEHDPTGWWMSEKLDGVRAYWDGETFLSRNGNVFVAPDWFVADLPADTLDGELWVGRKMFSQTMSIVRSGGAGREWEKVKYVVFDAPCAKGGFEDRIAHAERVLKKSGAPHALALEQAKCDGFDHLREELARIEALGGEGLMLRKPGSRYDVGRSMSLLKVKTFHDREARVVAHAPGTGKHKGRLGALVCELPDGTQFNIGTGFSDAEREDPPEIGAVVTFRYQELTNDGVPRFPSWVGVRIDLDWPPPEPTKVAKGSTPAVKAKKPAPPPPDDEEEVEEADEDEEEAPPPKKTAKPVAAAKPAKKAAPPPPDDEEEEVEEADEDDEEAPPPPKKTAKPVAAKPAKKATPPPPDEDDEEEEAADESDDGDANPEMTARYGAVTWKQSLLNDDEEKFWNVEVRGTHHFATFGKIGSPGQMRLTNVGSASAAKTDAEKRAMQKRKEGYRIVKG